MNNLDFQFASYETLQEERSKLSRLYTFIWRYISKTISLSQSSCYALGLFSKDGLLLDLFARETSTLERFRADGIRAGSSWMNIGHNAVRQGIIGRESNASLGDENEFPPLRRYAIYYAPINIVGPHEPYDQMEECGLGIIAPVENAWDDYLTLIRGTAHDLMITLQFNNIATMYYEHSGKGILSIDNMMSTSGRNLATYFNKELFQILQIQPMNLYYQPVEALIDPPPANKELWDIVQYHRTIVNQPLKVTCQGKTVELIASTDAYNQPLINAHGVTFYFTTQQKMTARLSSQVANGAIKTFDDIIGESAGFKRQIQKAQHMAQTDGSILILGESGTGKDTFAQAIHNASFRRDQPFIALNCAVIPRDLMESTLFGYEEGFFTGTGKHGNIGKLELASGGTLFLDQIDELPLYLQRKLLHVMETRQLVRLGGSRQIRLDVRIIAASDIGIEDKIHQKQFLPDLYFRLGTTKLYLMPLRERRDDILPLAEYFIRKMASYIPEARLMRFSDSAAKLLTELDWPGNVRELQNLMECIVQLYPDDMILPEHIRKHISTKYDPEYKKPSTTQSVIPTPFAPAPSAADVPLPETPAPAPSIPTSPTPEIPPLAASAPTTPILTGYKQNPAVSNPAGMPYSAFSAVSASSDREKPAAPVSQEPPAQPTLMPAPAARGGKRKHFTKDDLLMALSACGGNRSEACKYLGISRRTLYRKLEEFGIGSE